MSKMNFSDKDPNKKAAADIEVEDELDDEEDDESSYTSDEDKAKRIKVLLLPLGIIIVALILFFIIISFAGGNKSFEQIEEIMVVAAKSYFKDHPENLPKKDGGTQAIDVSTLVSEGRMKAITEYNESAICTGTVKVYKSGSSYLYVPKLDCGEAYSFKPLYEQIRADNPLVSTGYGLYNRFGNYVFRGENVNNYVKLDNATWRIIKIASGNQLVLMLDEPLSQVVPWDDRYNQDMNYLAGINSFSSSRIKEKLEELYTSTDSSVTENFLSDLDKTRMVSYNFCTGKRGPNETGVEQAVECREVTREQKIGLLTAADFMNASIDPDCTKATSPTCQNYNYLVTSNNWWLATPSSTNSYTVYWVGQNAGIEAKNANLYARLRPVIYLNSEVGYKSGSGTKEDPYIVK